MNPVEKLSSFVLARRKELSLSQSTVAETIHYTIQALSKFENNRGTLALSCLPFLAAALEVDVDHLLTYQNEKDPAIKQKEPIDIVILADNLTTARLKKGLSQKEAAERLLLSKQSLINYEKGRSYPSIETFYLMMDLYEKKPHELFYLADHQVLLSNEKKKRQKRILWISLGAVLLIATALSLSLPFLRSKGSQTALPIDELTGLNLSIRSLNETNEAYDVTSGATYDFTIVFSPRDWLTSDGSRSQYLFLKKKDGADIFLPESSNYATLKIASLTGPLEETLYLVCHDERRVNEVYSNIIKLRIL